MLTGVPPEPAANRVRAPVTPESARKVEAQGHAIRCRSGAGIAADAPRAPIQ